MFRSILVPLDGSAYAEHALPYAISIARRSGGQVQLARVHSVISPLYTEGAFPVGQSPDMLIRDEAKSYLERTTSRVPATAGVHLNSTLLEGPSIPDALASYAASSGSDLIVMTTHGRGALARAWLGSVADGLIRRLNIPILLVRPQQGEPEIDHEPALHHLMVALDGSALSEEALAPALELSKALGCKFTFLRVVGPAVRGLDTARSVTEPAGLALLAKLEAWHREELKEARNQLQRIADRFQAAHQVQTQVVVHDQAAMGILDQAKEVGADAIALATHGRGGVPRLVLGSVADKVIRGASLPVLVVRPAGS
jgi:nucleotide-binding universal stress UspA family protein